MSDMKTIVELLDPDRRREREYSRLDALERAGLATWRELERLREMRRQAVLEHEDRIARR